MGQIINLKFKTHTAMRNNIDLSNRGEHILLMVFIFLFLMSK